MLSTLLQPLMIWMATACYLSARALHRPHANLQTLRHMRATTHAHTHRLQTGVWLANMWMTRCRESSWSSCIASCGRHVGIQGVGMRDGTVSRHHVRGVCLRKAVTWCSHLPVPTRKTCSLPGLQKCTAGQEVSIRLDDYEVLIILERCKLLDASLGLVLRWRADERPG